MSPKLLGIAMPGPVEIIIMLVFAVVGIPFVFLLFRFLWQAGSKPVDRPPRS